jgi:hypothetical protein
VIWALGSLLSFGVAHLVEDLRPFVVFLPR